MLQCCALVPATHVDLLQLVKYIFGIIWLLRHSPPFIETFVSCAANLIQKFPTIFQTLFLSYLEQLTSLPTSIVCTHVSGPSN